ncbi:hypothetical protein ACFSR7_35980 [Cohnella sp. GCM10020058]|uniref:hypothetical protein n=1 Tax=Cohnella sp. GCM10020058 TaxID=3317330 RepID=UPI003628638B
MQMDIFPMANKLEIRNAKALLAGYRKTKAAANEFERRGLNNLAPSQTIKYNALQERVQAIESAVRLILDPDVRQIIETRYIKGERHKITIMRFSNYHEVTVGRKLNEGIESVANSLKLLTE